MKPTQQQMDFLAELETGKGNIALIARAGCGKTSTILMAVDAIASFDPWADIQICAFNKAIATEMDGKLKAKGYTDFRKVSASTLHAMGFGLLKFMFKPTVEGNKVRNLVDASNLPICQEYGPQVGKLVSLAKLAGFGFFPDKQIGDTRCWYDLANHFDVNGFDDTSEADLVIEAAQAIYRESLQQTSVVDFDDMILFPLVKNLHVKYTRKYVMVDEAQDLSPARQALIRKFVDPKVGRTIIVGDDRQAIYGFAGADAQALPNMISQLNAATLPLSVTWRCPKSVVALAQTLVPDIEAAPEAPEGTIQHISQDADDFGQFWGSVGPTDAILCRNVAPLITAAYKLIRAGKPCKVEGRAIGDGLVQLAKRWKVKSIDALLNRLDTYLIKETQKAMAKGNDAKVEEIEDKVQTMREICRACIEQGKTEVFDVVNFINSLFADGAAGVTILASYHRSKGREWKRVILWEHSKRCPSGYARQTWQIEQERNLAYVAFTRSMNTLVFVN